jgi:queuine tRNA-ribosyltransferase
MMAFDECATDARDRALAEAAVERTARWAERSLAARRDHAAALFGIVQGGTFDDLRSRSLGQISALPFDGFAIGGVSVGEGTEAIRAVVAGVTPRLPATRPRYLMGVGTPEDLVESVAAGVDLFDCVMPTRHARTGQLFTRRGRINIKNARHQEDQGPVDPECSCPVCARFSRGYLRHLFLSGEMLGPRLNTVHNLHVYLDLMARARRALEEGSFDALLSEEREARADGREAV